MLTAVLASAFALLASAAFLVALLRLDAAVPVTGNQDGDFERLALVEIGYALLQPLLLAVALAASLSASPGRNRRRAITALALAAIAAAALLAAYPTLTADPHTP